MVKVYYTLYYSIPQHVVLVTAHCALDMSISRSTGITSTGLPKDALYATFLNGVDSDEINMCISMDLIHPTPILNKGNLLGYRINKLPDIHIYG